MRRSFMFILPILAMVLTIGIANYSFISSKNYNGERYVKGIPSFEVIGGRTISYEKLMEFIVFRNLTIYLPSWLPHDFSLTAISVSYTHLTLPTD